LLHPLEPQALFCRCLPQRGFFLFLEQPYTDPSSRSNIVCFSCDRHVVFTSSSIWFPNSICLSSFTPTTHPGHLFFPVGPFSFRLPNQECIVCFGSRQTFCPLFSRTAFSICYGAHPLALTFVFFCPFFRFCFLFIQASRPPHSRLGSLFLIKAKNSLLPQPSSVYYAAIHIIAGAACQFCPIPASSAFSVDDPWWLLTLVLFKFSLVTLPAAI